MREPSWATIAFVDPSAVRRRTRPASPRGDVVPIRRFLVFDARFRLWGESTGAARWLERTKGEAELLSAIRLFQRSRQAAAVVVMDFGEVRITKIRESRSVRFLVELPLRTARTATEMLLSKTQIQVARRASEGATLHEIARAMNRSPDTVRSHLREIYRRLDVASRLELAGALAGAEGRR